MKGSLSQKWLMADCPLISLLREDSYSSTPTVATRTYLLRWMQDEIRQDVSNAESPESSPYSLRTFQSNKHIDCRGSMFMLF